MNVLLALNIPRTELKEFKDYIGFLFKNESGVYNICNTEEDIQKSNQWFKNFPLDTIVVSEKHIKKGDKFLAQCNNRNLNNKVFKYVGVANEHKDWKKCTDEIILLEDGNGEQHLSTETLLDSSYYFVRKANKEELAKVVNKQSLDVALKLTYE